MEISPANSTEGLTHKIWFENSTKNQWAVTDVTSIISILMHI